MYTSCSWLSQAKIVIRGTKFSRVFKPLSGEELRGASARVRLRRIDFPGAETDRRPIPNQGASETHPTEFQSSTPDPNRISSCKDDATQPRARRSRSPGLPTK